ncbi:hypothetical protein ACIQU7_23880 [Streptomyces albidoflavus]
MTATRIPPATLETVSGLPPACCPQGRSLLAEWVRAYADSFARQQATAATIDAEWSWIDHQVSTHRLNPPRVAGCPNCAEWASTLDLGPDEAPDLETRLGYEAARHAVRHQVYDPLVRHHHDGQGPV